MFRDKVLDRMAMRSIRIALVAYVCAATAYHLVQAILLIFGLSGMTLRDPRLGLVESVLIASVALFGLRTRSKFGPTILFGAAIFALVRWLKKLNEFAWSDFWKDALVDFGIPILTMVLLLQCMKALKTRQDAHSKIQASLS
jgi:hypothetical protein